MSFYRNFIKGRIFISFLLLLSFIAVSCQEDKETDLESSQSDFTLSLTLFSGNRDTRAVNASDLEVYETYIDPYDTWILFLDSDDVPLSIVSGLNCRATYSVSTTTFHYGTKDDDLIKKLLSGIPFKVAVISNWKDYDNSFDFSDLDFSSQKSIWEVLKNCKFNTQVGEDGNSWMPFMGSEIKSIPMFGYTTNECSFTTDQKIEIKVEMQRSLVKIELADYFFNIEDADNHTSLKVTDITLSSAKAYGLFAPLSDQYPISNKPNIADDNTLLYNIKLCPVTVAATQYTPSYTKWVAYVPEMSLGEEFTEERPHLDIKVKDSNGDNEDSAIQVMLRLDFAKYDADGNESASGNDYDWTSLVRNHNYRFTLMSMTKYTSEIDPDFTGHYLRFGKGYWFLYDETNEKYYFYDDQNEGKITPVLISQKAGEEWWYIERKDGKTHIFIDEEWVQINVLPGDGNSLEEDKWTVWFKVNGEDLEREITVTKKDDGTFQLSFDVTESIYLAPDNREMKIKWTYIYQGENWIKTNMEEISES